MEIFRLGHESNCELNLFQTGIPLFADDEGIESLV